VILDLLVLYPCWLQTSFLLAHILSLLPEHHYDHYRKLIIIIIEIFNVAYTVLKYCKCISLFSLPDDNDHEQYRVQAIDKVRECRPIGGKSNRWC